MSPGRQHVRRRPARRLWPSLCSTLCSTLAAALFLSVGCGLQSSDNQGADTGGVSEPRPALTPAEADDLVTRFQAELDRLYNEAQATEENFPGATAAFILPDGRVFGFATGLSDIDDQIPMAKDLRMPSGSIGKTYVAAVALQLAQEGRLDLDAPLSSFLGEEPWFSRLPNGPDLTLRILLTHTGGMIQPYFEDPGFAEALRQMRLSEGPDRFLSPQELVESILDHQPLFPAGDGYHYSDVSYILVGLVIEKVTGRLYYDLLDEVFLDPLDLDFTLAADRRDLPGLAQGYAHESSQLFGTPLEVVEDGRLVLHPLGEWTGGGLVNNPQDLVRWAKLLYEGEAIVGDDLPQLLEVGFAADAEKPGSGYGLGVFIDQDTEYGPTYGHSGFFPGYNSRVVYFPDYRVAIAMQINSDSSEASRHNMALAAVVLDALAETATAH